MINGQNLCLYVDVQEYTSWVEGQELLEGTL